MSDKKIIVVFGATGAQGGGLARAILNDRNSEFAVRAVTREPSSERAKELINMGAEVVFGDVDDLQSIKKTVEGAYGAYFVTFFWSHLSPEKEMTEAKAMAQAARDADLKHVIWSTLEDTRKYVPLNDNRMPTLQGKYKVPHFDGKGESNQYFIQLKVPVTFLLPSFYWENMLYFGMGPKPDENGELAITFPMGDKKLAGIAAEDIGKCAYGLFKRGSRVIGKTIGIAGDQLTCNEMALALTEALGKRVYYREVTPEQFRGLGFPGADDLGNMFQFYRDFDQICNSVRDVNYTMELNHELQSFKTWLLKNAHKIPIESVAHH